MFPLLRRKYMANSHAEIYSTKTETFDDVQKTVYYRKVVLKTAL